MFLEFPNFHEVSWTRRKTLLDPCTKHLCIRQSCFMQAWHAPTHILIHPYKSIPIRLTPQSYMDLPCSPRSQRPAPNHGLPLFVYAMCHCCLYTKTSYTICCGAPRRDNKISIRDAAGKRNNAVQPLCSRAG